MLPTVVFTFMICLAVFVVMFLFLAWNVFLILTNQTTIEFHFNRWKRSSLVCLTPRAP